jgi:hypothetical protein
MIVLASEIASLGIAAVRAIYTFEPARSGQ